MPPGRIAMAAKYLPERVVTNRDLIDAYQLPYSAEWVQQATGIRERRFAGPMETTLSMAAAVVRELIERGCLPDPFVDVLIVTSERGEEDAPSAAAAVAQMVGLAPVHTIDLSCGCGGFAEAFDVANQHLQAGAERALVVSSEVQSRDRLLAPREGDSALWALLGDGAGGVLLERSDVLCVEASARGAALGQDGDRPRGCDALSDDLERARHAPFCASRQAISELHLRRSIEVSRRALSAAGVGMDAVRWLVTHQPRLDLLEALREELGASADQHPIHVDRYGNTASASVPICLAELIEDGQLQRGDRILLVGMGAGTTAHVVRY